MATNRNSEKWPSHLRGAEHQLTVRLPEQLVAGFRATLEEVVEAMAGDAAMDRAKRWDFDGIWMVTDWWFQTVFFSISYVEWIILPIDELIFFRGVGIPPTRWSWGTELGWFDLKKASGTLCFAGSLLKPPLNFLVTSSNWNSPKTVKS